MKVRSFAMRLTLLVQHLISRQRYSSEDRNQRREEMVRSESCAMIMYDRALFYDKRMGEEIDGD